MKKYPAILATFCVALCLVLVGCGNEAQTSTGDVAAEKPQKVYRWKLVSTYPKNFPGLGVAAENLVKLIDETSNFSH